MNVKRQIAAIGGTLALVAAGASVALVGGLSSSNAAESPSSAYGLVATGLIPIQKTPTVVSTTGKKATDSLVAFPSNPLLTGGIVNVLAENDHAEADLANLGVGKGLLSQLSGPLSQLTTQLKPVCDALKQVPVGQLNGAVSQVTGNLLPGLLQPILTAAAGSGVDLSLLTAIDLTHMLPSDLSGLCNVLTGNAGLVGATAVKAECHGHTGTTTIADLLALGLPVHIDTSKANASITIPGLPNNQPLVKITVNEQKTNPDGTFTVNALHVQLLGQQDIVVASATCGHISTKTPTSSAPTPTPTHTRAAVTG